jgi:PAS domain S-box-containing protein
MSTNTNEDELLRSVALQNARAILVARERAERSLLEAKKEVERKNEELSQQHTWLIRQDEAVRRSEQLNRSIIASTGDCITVLDLEGKLLSISDNGKRMLGLADGQSYLDKSWIDWWKGEGREAALSAIRSAAEGKSSMFVGFLETVNGESKWLDTNVTPILGSDARPERLLSVSRDVTERRQAEERLWRLAAVIESSDDSILSMSLDGTVTTWNGGAERMYGYTAAEIIGHPVEILLPPNRPNEELDILERLKRGERIEHYETVRRTKAGADLDVSLTVSPILDATGKIVGISKISRDITQRKRAAEVMRQGEEDLRRAQDKLSRYAEDLEKQVAQRTRALGEKIGELESFSYSVSHDLRAPLRAIQSFAAILEEERGAKITGDEREYLRRIISAAGRMDRLIQDVLNYSRITRAEVRSEPMDLGKLLRGIVESYPIFQPPSAVIDLEGTFPEVLGSDAMLTQCVSNILSNAVKFVAPGVTPRVRVWAETTSDRARVFFKDNGVGIPAEAHEKIFGIFERVSNHYEGTGIGLSIVKKAIERMGGAVRLESEVGRGTTFWLELNRPKRNPS